MLTYHLDDHQIPFSPVAIFFFGTNAKARKTKEKEKQEETNWLRLQ
jgi:hypothetical protein